MANIKKLHSYLDSRTGVRGFGRTYGQYSLNGTPLYPGTESLLFGSPLLLRQVRMPDVSEEAPTTAIAGAFRAEQLSLQHEQSASSPAMSADTGAETTAAEAAPASTVARTANDAGTTSASMEGPVIPGLERVLKNWLRHQGKTLHDWAIELQAAGFMMNSHITEVESVLDAAANRGAWVMDDPLTVASEFLTSARKALVCDSIDKQLHEDAAMVIFEHLCVYHLAGGGGLSPTDVRHVTASGMSSRGRTLAHDPTPATDAR